MGPAIADPITKFLRKIERKRRRGMDKKKRLLHTILTAATILMLLMIAWQCLDIYIAGNGSANLDENGLYIQPVYRVDDVIARFNSLKIWAITYLALLITACAVIPETAGEGSAVTLDPDNRLRLMKKKLQDLPEAAQKEETLRKKIGYDTATVIFVCAALSLMFLLNRDNFTSWDLEMVMGQMLLHVLPWVIFAFAAVIVSSFLCRRSMEREIVFLKGLSGTKTPDAVQMSPYLTHVRIALYILAAVMIVHGIRNGGMQDVLIKAINICTECIGLG